MSGKIHKWQAQAPVFPVGNDRVERICVKYGFGQPPMCVCVVATLLEAGSAWDVGVSCMGVGDAVKAAKGLLAPSRPERSRRPHPGALLAQGAGPGGERWGRQAEGGAAAHTTCSPILGAPLAKFRL